MRHLFSILLLSVLGACSSMIPYKDQSLDYLHGIVLDASPYRGKIVSFGGEVKGITEDTRQIRLVLKIDVPLYYYATGKDTLSYELLLVTFSKKGIPQMTGIQKGNQVKVLARVADYETRKNLMGKDIAVLRLEAIALANRTKKKDFFRTQSPDAQLYDSWKKGRLFFEEQPQEIIDQYPPETTPQEKVISKPANSTPLPPAPLPPAGIVFDEEETFILPQ